MFGVFSRLGLAISFIENIPNRTYDTWYVEETTLDGDWSKSEIVFTREALARA